MAGTNRGIVVVITGTSSGVGKSTARLLAGNVAKAALGARRKDRIDALLRRTAPDFERAEQRVHRDEQGTGQTQRALVHKLA